MPFHFAWVDSTDTAFLPAFEREDEQVLSFDVDHAEGEFATLTLEIKNPRTGLLSVGRKQWAWLAWDDGGSSPVPLFFGRLVAAPENAAGEVVTLTFRARPDDYGAAKEAAADALRVLPWHDPVWIAPDMRDDPDVVLEARTALWHIDRLTHAVTATDIVAGELGTVALGGGFFRDSLAIGHASIPARTVVVKAEVAWKQAGSFTLDLSKKLTDAFAAAGTTYANLITSYTGEGLMRDWPDAGDRIGGGWIFETTRLSRLDGVILRPSYKIANTTGYSKIAFPLFMVRPVLKVRCDYSRDRVEGVSFTLAAGVQDLATDSAGDDALTISLQSTAPGELIDGVVPITDVRRARYFRTTRGRQSIENLILRARAMLVARARAVMVSADIPFEDAVTLTGRESVQLTDARLPGGQATGKVAAYGFRVSGDTGQMMGRVTIACTIGTGDALFITPPDPDYVASGYVGDSYQTASGGQTALPSADIGYEIDDGTGADDGANLLQPTIGQMVLGLTVANGQAAQEAALDAPHADAATAAEALNAVATTVTLNMMPLDGLSFRRDYAVTPTAIAIPKTIDLEAV